LPDVDGALAELAYALDSLRLDGVVLFSNVRGTYLGDPRNTFARIPDVKYVFAHPGGTVPYLAGRFGIIDEMRVIPGAEACATAAETFRRLYWDTAASWGDPVLRMLRDVAGIDRVVFGTDADPAAKSQDRSCCKPASLRTSPLPAIQLSSRRRARSRSGLTRGGIGKSNVMFEHQHFLLPGRARKQVGRYM
jgi:predicted TIM-barrel fold metal-dependent hydrolase